MSNFPFLITVDERDRTVRRIVHEPPPIADDVRARLNRQLDDLLDEMIVDGLAWDRADAATKVAVHLVLQEADEHAYRRVCEQRGVLAL